MRVSLIFPPATDPRAPHLALPYLAAVLRRAGVATTLIDADLDGLLWLLRPEVVAHHLRRVAKAPPGRDADEIARLLRRGDRLVEDVPRALAILRDRVGFYDPHAFAFARETIQDAVQLAAAGTAVRYDLCPIRYEVAGIDEQRLPDLIAASTDPRANLFEEHWRAELLPALDRERPDLVGLSIVNRQQILPGLALARRLKAGGHRVVIGGTVFTKFVRQLLARPELFAHFADGIVAYEGETAILALIEALRRGDDLGSVPNLLSVADGRVRMGPTRVEDVDELPTPDFAGLPLGAYLAPEPVLPILIGKGCYFNECKFCDIPFINHVSRKPYRVRSTQRIVEDILTLNDRTGCRHFVFTDEALPPRLLERLADALEPHRDRGFSFVGYARFERGFTGEVCAKIARMGMRKIFFGLESGDQATLDHMRKGVRIADVRPVLSHCREAGILFHIFSMVGFPEETRASARTTLRFFEENADVIDHPGNTFDIHPFGLELRTGYFAEAAELGVDVPEEALAKDFVIGVRSGWSNARGLSQDEVMALVAEYGAVLRTLYARHHNTPLHLWPGFEEYAILYGDRYRNRDFPYRTSLPEDGDPRPFTIAWNPAAAVDRRDGLVRVASRTGAVTVDETLFGLFAAPRPRRVGDVLAACAALQGEEADPAETRAAIDAMVGARLLQITLARDGPARSAPEERVPEPAIA
ncbi:MAG: radical SAM protein [Methylobacterium sp.]|uniref:B12-binding domain-containing radical SAM protein n=1 Tax=Methylobacterium sp. TaxID=409 RepID=UPI002586E56D|nr:radical SAM protein [Methylobacterium sp.]MBY0296372.1 radical SAM protein [Methylobacterium sp.]